MDLAHGNFAPSRRRPSRRAGRRGRFDRAQAGLGTLTTGPARIDGTAPPYQDWRPPQQALAENRPATVAELSQIPGAREALANYIGILQEWSSRADEGGAASRNSPR